MSIKSFHINISQSQIDDLHERIKKTIMKELTRKALSLPFEDLSIANVADRKVNATKLGIHTADA